jgi:uncharacterized lipoprotein NlpE involved in copper resistance
MKGLCLGVVMTIKGAIWIIVLVVPHGALMGCDNQDQTEGDYDTVSIDSF